MSDLRNPSLSWTTISAPAGHIDEWIGKINHEEVYSVCLAVAEYSYFRLYHLENGEKEIGTFTTLSKAVHTAHRHSLGIDV